MYKTKLSTYGKKRFDSFRRTKPTILFTIKGREDKPLKTTIAQLQWCRWIYEQRIMEHVISKMPIISQEMAKKLKQQRSRMMTNKDNKDKDPKQGKLPLFHRSKPEPAPKQHVYTNNIILRL